MLKLIAHYAEAWKLRKEIVGLKRQHDFLSAQLEASEAEAVDLNRELKKHLLAVIGALVILWAYLENTIDAWVEVIHRTGGADDIQAHLPRSLDRELDYLKAAWKTTKVGQELKEEGSRLMAEIHRLKNFRHDLVHGLADLNSSETLVIHLWKTKGADRVELKTPYPVEKIRQNVSDIVALKGNLDAFVIAFTHATVDVVKRSR